MTEIEPYAPREVAVPATDSWVDVIAPVGDLAGRIAGTDFVPKDFRGKPAAVAAAILFGREVGLPPITTLKNTYVVHGTPDLSAEAQRALVYAAGHEIRFVETTATRCRMEGRRRGVEDWTPASYSMDEARQSGDAAKNSNYKTRPVEMLIARCTTRLCSMIFSDVIGGFTAAGSVPLPINDQAAPEVAPATVTVTAAEPVAAPAVEAPKPKPKPRKRAATKSLPAAPEPVAEPVADTGPPLPGEAGFEQIGQDAPPADEPVDAELVEDEPEPLRTDAQSKHLFALLRELGIATRDEGLEMIASILGHEVESTKTLSKSQASKVIDALVSMVDGGSDEQA